MRTDSTIQSVVVTLVAASILAVAAPAWADLTVPDSAYGEGAIHDGVARVESRLVVDARAVAPGDTIRVGIAFDLDRSWHIYWQNPGEAGVPTDIQWSADNLEFGPLKWAAPALFGDPGGEFISFGYADEVVLFSDATVAGDASGAVEIGASVDYLACSNLCMPGHAQLTRRVPVAERTRPADSSVLDAIERSVARVPRRAGDIGLTTRFHYSQTPIRPGDQFEGVIEVVECQKPAGNCRAIDAAADDLQYAFVGDRFSDVDIDVTAITPHPSAASGLVFYVDGRLDESAGAKPLISGVVQLQTGDGANLPVHLRDPLDTAQPGAAVERSALPEWAGLGVDPRTQPTELTDSSGAGVDSAPMSVGWAILLAFFGGIILNLMPCVFPVLALKLSAFTRLVHESKRSVLAHGAAYTGGIVATMVALAAVVIGIRMTGTQVGWGFQFQHPSFLAALVILLVLFALNLFGVFEVSVNATGLHDKTDASDGVRRSFWEGILAVVLATPCSAPFLGAAVGFALAGSAATIVAVFVALGLGLAAPMVVLTLMPGWAKLLPAPGDWMVHLKKVMGFALMGSAIWIIWLVGRQTGVDQMAGMLVVAAVVALAAWMVGRVQFSAWSPTKAAVIAAALAAVGIAGAAVFPLHSGAESAAGADTTGASSAIDWQPWSESAVQAALDQGQPVFVDFGADWCLTCKVNEKQAIDTASVRQAVDAHDVAMFRADWTHPDETIRQKLAEFDRAGVPFYLVYSPAKPHQPRPLSEVISSDELVDALTDASEGP